MIELYTGTEIVGTAEWSMTTDTAGPDADTTPGTYQPYIDFVNMAADDVFEVRVYEKARSADTQRLLQAWTLTGAQSSPLWTTTATFTLLHGWDFTLKKISGTDRTITWSIRDVIKAVDVGAIGSIATGGIASASFATAALQAIADAWLDRNMATGVDSGTDSTGVRTPRQALRSLRNKVSQAAGIATVTKEDDTTASWTAALTTAAGNPISGVDPT